VNGVDLAQWLGAQLDADERIARAAMSGTWQARTLPGNIEHVHPAFWVDAEHTDGEGTTDVTVADCQWSLADAQHIAEHDPARVLREIEAKRRIVDAHERRPMPGGYTADCAQCWGAVWPCPTLRLLALPYDDRPGYQEAWRP
jgi:hypothetical protein